MKKIFVIIPILLLTLEIGMIYQYQIKKTVEEEQFAILVNGVQTDTFPNDMNENNYFIDINCTDEVTGEYSSKEGAIILSNLENAYHVTCKVSLESRTNLIYATSLGIAESMFLNSSIKRNSIETVRFLNFNNVPGDAIGSWDASEQQNGNIMAYYYDADGNGLYELYIGQDGGVTAGQSLNYLFQYCSNLKYVDFEHLNTQRTTSMIDMFHRASVGTMDLIIRDLDTSNVTDMSSMFRSVGVDLYQSSLTYGAKTIRFDGRFDTSNVTTMRGMFSEAAKGNSNLVIDLGSNFNTSKVTDMQYMFGSTGQNSLSFQLNLGDKFNTSKVEDMVQMFSSTGEKSTNFILELGNKFDTSNVKKMDWMFEKTGYSSPIFTLDLGEHFNTSNVKSMKGMFYQTGYSSQIFQLDLGSNFDTANVTDMYITFNGTGYLSPTFTLNLGNKFDTSNVENMRHMFNDTGYSSTIFTLDLGNKFDTSKVNDMVWMFYNTGYSSPIFTLNLGKLFSLDGLGSAYYMFNNTGLSNPNKVLDLRDVNVTKLLTQDVRLETSFMSAGSIVYVKDATDAAKFSIPYFHGTAIDCSSNSCP